MSGSGRARSKNDRCYRFRQTDNPQDSISDQFFDYATLDSGRIPDYILKDEKLVSQLPVFFRTISG